MQTITLKKLLVTALGTAAIALGIGSAAQAAVIFSDNFDQEAPGGLNFTTFDKWDVTDGTVDVIPVGGSFNYYPGNGSYVDLDGSTGDAGVLTTKQAFNPGTYLLKFVLGGSTVQNNLNDVLVSFGSLNEIFTVASDDPLKQFTRAVTLGSASKLSFSNAGGDNIGAILDSASVETIPTPVLLPGLIGLGIGVLRKRKVAQAEA